MTSVVGHGPSLTFTVEFVSMNHTGCPAFFCLLNQTIRCLLNLLSLAWIGHCGGHIIRLLCTILAVLDPLL